MEEKTRQRRSHSVNMQDRSRLELTGITDVVSFDLNKVILESDYGAITIKGNNLHVSRLSIEKGELDIDGTIQAMEYSQTGSFSGKGESLVSRLFK